MGSEIELKIPLSKTEYDGLFDEIWCKQKVEGIKILDFSKDEVFKQDEYFSKYKTLEERKNSSEPQVIRIRTEITGGQKKSYFTIKRKTLRDGVEVNREDETFLEDAEVLREFFEEAGYWRWFNKEKKAFSAHCAICGKEELAFHVELVVVNEMPYVEIEITAENVAAEVGARVLEEFVQLLGLDPAKKDGRSWYSIICE